MDGQLARRLDPCDGGLDLVHQGHHIPGIARMPSREMRRKEKAGGGLRDDPGLAPTLGRTVACALENRSNSTIVGIDDLALVPWLALREPLRWSAESVRRLERCPQVALHTRALTRRAMGRWPDGQGAATLPELLCCLAHQRHEDCALPAALSTTAAHALREVVVEGGRLGLQRGRVRGALRRDGLDEVEDFFCALSSVVAAVTRWLPCSTGKVSTRRCAGLTSPSSMAAAAWMASSSSIQASSRRWRNWSSVSGNTTCSCGQSHWTHSRPQAYMTAKSVRKR